jgi:GGDEF domain-containing protein
VLVEGADDTQLAHLLDRLRQRIAAPMDIGPLTLSVGVSIGLARYPDEASDCASLIELADRRMYTDKVAKSAAPIPT